MHCITDNFEWKLVGYHYQKLFTFFSERILDIITENSNWNTGVVISIHSGIFFWFRANPVFVPSQLYCMLSEEASNANSIFFGLTRPDLEPTIYQTPE